MATDATGPGCAWCEAGRRASARLTSEKTPSPRGVPPWDKVMCCVVVPVSSWLRPDYTGDAASWVFGYWNR
ncbi:hypothetical protein [Streptomyces rubrogriseus]|uniref:hypothetical protein n=1 Tax=Streptomyces rubrogriseus TaxID=194673 RepID=UPI00364F1C49